MYKINQNELTMENSDGIHRQKIHDWAKLRKRHRKDRRVSLPF